MEFFEAVKTRRSVRRFTTKPVPTDVIEKALDAALIAPNSSNVQTWDFHWVNSSEAKSKMVVACLSQSAARTAQDLLVITVNPKLWRRSNADLIQFVERTNAPKPVHMYYKKLVPLMYTWGWFNSIGFLKMLAANAYGLFKPSPRGPNTKRDLQEVCIKSAALAAENFALAIAAQGYNTCMMEGFDQSRVRKALGLGCGDRVVMVIAIGEAAADGIWGPQFRIAKDKVVHKY